MATVIASPVATYQADALTQQKSNGDILIATQVNQWINDLRELNDAVHGTLAVPAWTVTGNASVGGTFGVTGATTLAAVTATGNISQPTASPSRNIGDGTGSPTSFYAKGAATNGDFLALREGGTASSNTRWSAQFSSDEDIQVIRHDGAGSTIGASVRLDWATGNVTLANDLACVDVNASGNVTMTGGDLYLNSATPYAQIGNATSTTSDLYFNKVATGTSTINFYDASVVRNSIVHNASEDILIRQHNGAGTVTSTTTVANSNGRWTFPAAVRIDGDIQLSAGSRIFRAGTGTPEAAVTASVGSLFMRTDGGAGTCLYVKESGAGNTGWVAK